MNVWLKGRQGSGANAFKSPKKIMVIKSKGKTWRRLRISHLLKLEHVHLLMGRSPKRGNSPEWLDAMRLQEGMALRAEARRISLRQKRHLFHDTGMRDEHSARSVWWQEVLPDLSMNLGNLSSKSGFSEKLSTVGWFHSIHFCNSPKKEADFFPFIIDYADALQSKITSFQSNWN